MKVLAVGDIMLGVCSLNKIADNKTIPNQLLRNPHEITKYVKPLFQSADVVFGNLECVFSEEFYALNLKNIKLLIAPPDSSILLKENNFTILNLANNHILDHGVKKVRETINTLENVGIKYIGEPTKLKKKQIEIIHVKNKKIGFLGYNLCEQGEQSSIEEILASIKKNRSSVDILFLSLHWGWGSEHMEFPSPSQVELGHMFIDHGVDVILGHHSHVFQPVELYHNKIICYSLGNFIFDMDNEKNRKSGIVEILIDNDNNLSNKLIPTEQVENYVLRVDEQKHNTDHLIVSNYLVKLSPDEYAKTAKIVKSQYNKEILFDYLINFYKYPLTFHSNTVRRWISKFLSK
nr:CapA family protein [Methanosarcina siciliae]